MCDTTSDLCPGHSTGPRSDNGKQSSSRNAATHGLSCETFFLIPGETQESFDSLAQSLTDEYQNVASPGLKPLLDTLVQALWLQNRAYKRVFESELALATAEFNRESSEIVQQTFDRLKLMQRYKTSYENSCQRALRAVEAYRKNRLAWQVAQVRIEQALYSMVQSKLKSFDRLIKQCGYSDEEAWEKIKQTYPPNYAPPSSAALE